MFGACPYASIVKYKYTKNIETKCKSENECRLHPTEPIGISGFYTPFYKLIFGFLIGLGAYYVYKKINKAKCNCQDHEVEPLTE